jgi:hypothetical protein
LVGLNNIDNLFEMVALKLSDSKHSELLKTLVTEYLEGGTEAVDAKVKEILSKIEEE